MTAEGRLRGVLAGLLLFLAASGAVTWSQPRPGIALQFLQLAHMVVGFAVVTLGVVYLALHLAQTLPGVVRALGKPPRTSFAVVGMLVIATWLGASQKMALVNVLAVAAVIVAGTGLLLVAGRVTGLGRAASVVIALSGALVLFVLTAVGTGRDAPLVLSVGVVVAALLLWSAARSGGSVTKTLGGFGGLAMLICFVAAIGGAGTAAGLMLYARLPILENLPIPWFVHVLFSWCAVAVVAAHIRASRARSARQRSTSRRAYPWRQPFRRQALPALVVASLASALLVAMGTSKVPSFGADQQALVPIGAGFSEVLPASCESCHAEVVEGWSHSSHARAADNPFFTGLLRRLRDERGPEELRVCLRCHAPHALDPAGASFESVVESEGYRAGVHCVSCHRTTPGGDRDGALVATPLGADSFSLLVDRPGVLPRLDREDGRGLIRNAEWVIRNTLISSRLERHRERYRFAIHDPASCRPCHVQTLGPSTHGRVAHVLQDQYTSWRESPAAAAGMNCATCHMTHYQVNYPVHDHRFLTASTYVAAVENGPAGMAEVEANLEGRVLLPPDDPGHSFYEFAVPKERPAQTAEGSLLLLEVQLVDDVLLLRTRNSGKIGHVFPTGPTDLFQVWLSVRATDERGRPVLEIGTHGPEGAPQLGDRLFDERGDTIHDHRLWAVDKAVDLGRIPVVGAHEVRLDGSALRCAEADPTCRFRVEAAWNYRRLDPALVAQITGEAGPELPIVQVGKVTADVAGAPRLGGQETHRVD